MNTKKIQKLIGKIKKNDKFAEILLANPLTIFITLFLLSFLFLNELVFWGLKLPLLILILFSIFLSEIFLRGILFLIYGKKYIFRFIPFKIKSDKECGYKFKPNINAKKIDFPIFDRDAFPEGMKIPLEKKSNKFLRVSFSTDKNSLRKTPYKLNKKSNHLKIICSGGSTTAGFQVHDSETWPNQLKKKLNKKGINCEILNAGVYGYDSFQELQNIKYNLIKFKPDAIILHQGWNEEFEFSALGAGKYFKPQNARKYFEKFYFFTNNIRFFPRKSLLAILTFRYLRRKVCLEGRMSFQKKERWNVLLNDIYIKNWFDNIFEIYKLCKKNNIQLFLTDYPCLVNTNDTPDNREIYVRNSRLTHNFAKYQAFSKARIIQFYQKIRKYFEILECESNFNRLSGKERLNYFADEIHLSKKGEELLSESICKSIIKNINYEFVEKPFFKDSKKEFLTNKDFLNLRKSIGLNSSDLNIEIRREMYSLEIEEFTKISIATDSYTTS